MGIQGLLPYLSKACREANVGEFKGQTAAVDTSCWLHRGVFGAAEREARGQPTDFATRYCLKLVRALRERGVRVVLVFDGRALPAKARVNEQRRERRDRQRDEARRLQAAGRAADAADCLRQATEVTFEHVHQLIQRCRGMDGVECLVAPYESDAQIAFLCQQRVAQLAVSEDSDLIPFGCDKVLFKMDATGRGMLYERTRLPAAVFGRATDFDFDKFRRVCVLAGCDYLPDGLPGVGLLKAAKFFAKTDCTDLRRVLPRIPSYLNMNQLKVTTEFVAAFIKAEKTFLYQVVFDPRAMTQRRLHADHSDPCDSLAFAGTLQPAAAAVQLALGNVHTRTFAVVASFRPPVGADSFWGASASPAKTTSAPARRTSPRKRSAKAAAPTGAFRVTPSSAATSVAKPIAAGRKRVSPLKRRGVGAVRSASIVSWARVDVLRLYGVAAPTLDDADDDAAAAVEPLAAPDSPYFAASSAARNPFKRPQRRSPSPATVPERRPARRSPKRSAIQRLCDQPESVSVGDSRSTSTLNSFAFTDVKLATVAK